MKTIGIILMVLALVGCNEADVTLATESSVTHVQVAGITCKSCPVAVEGLTKDLSVEMGFVDYADGTMEVRLGNPDEFLTLKEILEAKGFPITVLENP